MINPHPQQLSMGLLTPGVLGGGGGEGGGSHGAELSGVLGVAVAPVSEVGAGAVVQAAPVVQVAPGGEGGGGGMGGEGGGRQQSGRTRVVPKANDSKFGDPQQAKRVRPRPQPSVDQGASKRPKP